jgi:PD-(D/E)XK nuclease superfamily
VIERAAEARLAGLPGNPRLSDDLRMRIQRGLRDRVADARVQVQAFISNAVIALGGKAQEAVTPAAGRAPGAAVSGERAPLSLGSHAEVTLTVPQLRLTGRVELLRIAEPGAHITDYKTGAESPSHSEQLRLYALLWDLDRDANPAGARSPASLPPTPVATPRSPSQASPNYATSRSKLRSASARPTRNSRRTRPVQSRLRRTAATARSGTCATLTGQPSPPIHPTFRMRPGSTARAWSVPRTVCAVGGSTSMDPPSQSCSSRRQSPDPSCVLATTSGSLGCESTRTRTRG